MSEARPGAVPAATVVIVPGWKGSGPQHWQSLWAGVLPRTVRVEQHDWLRPARAEWVAALAHTIESVNGPVVIAAHSLGCITTVHLPAALARRVSAALLVAPADPERRAVLSDFAPVPFAPLPYRSIVVAGVDDPYCSVRRAGAYARAWGSDFVRIPGAGHINIDSGHGDWPLGLALLRSLVDESETRAATAELARA